MRRITVLCSMNERNFTTATNVVNPLVQSRRHGEASVIKNFDVMCA
jgi:hypothetical protein